MRSTTLFRTWVVAALLLAPAVAGAHPGHGGSNGLGLTHWLIDHVLPAAVLGLLIAALITMWRTIMGKAR